ncbi:MAG: DNA polymerase II large subunit [Candidatus Thorarchaeota archaeon]|nr:MAG: DNA polymerase II large subunit [Candidatus Thorarchaeota archaeon]
MTESEHELPPHSIAYSQYFESLNEEINKIYAVAEVARMMGFDPVTRVEIPPAHDVAARVEATLEGPKGVAKRIRELQKDMSREQVAFQVAKEIAEGTLSNVKETVDIIVNNNPQYNSPQIMALIDDKRKELGPEANNGFAAMAVARDIGDRTARETAEKAADKAVRVALAILTESITAAPLEGIAKVSVRGSGESRYLALYLAGPIRAAGGTEAAMTVLVADYVRQVLDLPAFKSTEEETERALEEVELYARNIHLQYPVHPELIKFAAARLPIMLTGDPTESFEVSGGRDLERIETNRVRGGSVLVLSDGGVGRAEKLAKIVNQANIKGWEWLDDLASKLSKDSTQTEDSAAKKLEPKDDYLADVIGGRPVFSHPQRLGGFRLRYGRSRNTGLAGVGVHPATMFILEEFLAPGTHIRTERPGKGAIVAPVDTIEGPIVLLKDGSVIRFTGLDDARGFEGKVEQILYVGDILVALGEFIENNHPLAPSGYCEEWWSHDLEHAISILSSTQLTNRLKGSDLTLQSLNTFIESPLTILPTPIQAVHLSKKLNIPLHPYYLYRWAALSTDEIQKLRKWLLTNHSVSKKHDGHIVLPFVKMYKTMLECVGIPHRFSDNHKNVVLTDDPIPILAQLGPETKSPKGKDTIAMLNSVSDVLLRDKVGFSIGARMGRPEKAEPRRMKPPVQSLFPVGRSGGSERRIDEVANNVQYISTLESFDEGNDTKSPITSGVRVELVSRKCPGCKLKTFESKCPQCRTHTEIELWCGEEGCGSAIDSTTGMCPVSHSHKVSMIRKTRMVPIDLKALLERVKGEVGEFETHGVRGVLGLTSDYKIPEYLGKGILRAKHDVYCYRDGTARFDATDAPLTHFTPKEVSVPVSRLRELGYVIDYNGAPLISEEQVLELKVQDVVVPENCADYLLRVGRFVDDCLEKMYKLPRYYNFNSIEDVIGQLVIGLAPHTSAGIIGRLVGFTNASVCFAHPYWHAAKRRNCDGDEDALILVLDALLNFSKSYLPAGRGGLMDAPLVLSVILNPTEVDDESHNMEVCRRYPAQFYDMVSEARHPKDVQGLVDIILYRLNTPTQYEGFGFTHNTTSFDIGPKNSRYKILETMDDKLEAQLRLATLIKAVDAPDVAQRVLSTHFFRDIRGNLRAYSTQKIRCMKCNRTYRRVPISGQCICGESKLSLTVRQKNISKYLRVTEKIIHDYGLDQYMQERLKLISASLDSLFVSEQTSLIDFLEG